MVPYNDQRTIRVIDRFGIILQIFAARAKHRSAQLQIELAWLRYAKTLLARGGAPNFGKIGSMFQGNMMHQETADVQIVSAKGQKAGAVGGSGETQLEMEKFNIKIREAKLRKELTLHTQKENNMRDKKQSKHNAMPVIALVGYTNAGKTALVNMCSGSKLESEDRLF